MKHWKRFEPTKKFKQGHRTIVSKTFRLPDGRVLEFGTYNPEDKIDVTTIAITKQNRVLVFRQFRPGPEQIMDELPGGGADKINVDPKIEALRELEEETGYHPGHVEFLGRRNYDAYSNAWRNYYLALDCVPTAKGQKLDPNEMSGELLEISIDQLIENAKTGRMTDSGAILLAYDKLLKLKETKRL